MENKHLDSHYFKLSTLSPVHIGSGRKYMYGLDYIYSSKKLFFLNNDSIWKAFPNKLVEISKHLADGNISEVINLYKKLGVFNDNRFIIFQTDFPFRANEVFQAISDGFNRPIIPGSSIKGSLRSIILNRMYQENPGREMNERNLAGGIDDSLFKYIQVSDTTWKKRKVMPVKVFSGDLGNDRNPDMGQWKDAFRGGHNPMFREEDFTSGYEVIPDESYSYCRINWPSQRKAVNIRNFDRNVVGMNFFQNNDLIETIKNYTIEYLTKETDFFNHFENSGLMDDDDNNVISSYYDYLLEQNQKPGCFILRIGAGSGYYSVSGDWKHQDHLVTEIDLKTNRRKLPAKTRKISFTVMEEGYDFLPLGYVLFEEISRELYASKIEANLGTGVKGK